MLAELRPRPTMQRLVWPSPLACKTAQETSPQLRFPRAPRTVWSYPLWGSTPTPLTVFRPAIFYRRCPLPLLVQILWIRTTAGHSGTTPARALELLFGPPRVDKWTTGPPSQWLSKLHHKLSAHGQYSFFRAVLRSS